MHLKGTDGCAATVEMTPQEATRLAQACELAARQYDDPMTQELVASYASILRLVSLVGRRSPVRIYEAKPAPVTPPEPVPAPPLADVPEEVRPAFARHMEWLACLEPTLLGRWLDTMTELEPEHVAMVVSALTRRRQKTSEE